jgi:hypothetical protein
MVAQTRRDSPGSGLPIARYELRQIRSNRLGRPIPASTSDSQQASGVLLTCSPFHRL